MTWGWGTPVRMDGGGRRKHLLTPGSDWWLRGLDDAHGVALAKPVDRATFTAHPDDVAPLHPSAARRGSQQDRGDVPSLDPLPQTVIMGVIDDGIAFANARFLKPGPSGRYQTRLAAFWNQDASGGNDRPTDGYTLPFGHDWTEAEINTALFSYPDGALYPDPAFAYRASQMSRAVAGLVRHGTHVMDLATGYDCDVTTPNDLGEVPRDMAARRPIIAVQLAQVATQNTSGTFMAPYVTHAIDYILDRGVRLQPETGDRVPIVLNFSYGIYASALNGRAWMEEWIDDAVTAMWKEHRIPVWVVLPAGNSHLAQTHGEARVGATRPDAPAAHPLMVRHQPDNKAPTVVEFWWPERTISLKTYGLERVKGAKRGLNAKRRRQLVKHLSGVSSPLRLEIRPPGARDWISLTTPEVPFFHGVPLMVGETIVAMAYHEALLSFGRAQLPKDERALSAQLKLTLVFAPSALEPGQETPGSATLPAGDWEVRIWNEDATAEETVHVRCQRNDTAMGYRPAGRQSRLIDPQYVAVRPDGRAEEADNAAAWVVRRDTTNAIGSGVHTIRVASVRVSNLDRRDVPSNRIETGGASVFSSAGSADGPMRIDIAAASEVCAALPGVMAAGTHSGSRVRLSGTSAAAPQVARWIALAVAQPDTAPMRATLIAQAANATAPVFADSNTPERTGARVLLGPGAR